MITSFHNSHSPPTQTFNKKRPTASCNLRMFWRGCWQKSALSKLNLHLFEPLSCWTKAPLEYYTFSEYYLNFQRPCQKNLYPSLPLVTHESLIYEPPKCVNVEKWLVYTKLRDTPALDSHFLGLASFSPNVWKSPSLTSCLIT